MEVSTDKVGVLAPSKQDVLNELAEKLGIALDRRKSHENQMKDIEKAKQEQSEAKAAKDKAEKEAEQAKVADPSSWNYKEGYRFHCNGPVATGGIYIKDIKSGLEFFCPKAEIKGYLSE